MINHFVKREYQKGIAIAKPFWPTTKVGTDTLSNQVISKWPILEQNYGKATGQEFIREDKIGNSFIRYYYLHKFQNHSIYWQITFYKPLKEWKINTVTFKDSLEPLYKIDT